MQERVTPIQNQSNDVIVQCFRELDHVGVGLEPRIDMPVKHFIDQIYGDAPTQTQIGKIFFDQISEIGLKLEKPDSFLQSAEEEIEFYNNLGRRILDSVTGSTTVSGLWTWLDRPSVNRLIRLLRKARDEAFGRDE